MSHRKKIAKVLVYIFATAVLLFVLVAIVMLKKKPDIEPLLNKILTVFVCIFIVLMITSLILRKEKYYIPAVVILVILLAVYLRISFFHQ